MVFVITHHSSFNFTVPSQLPIQSLSACNLTYNITGQSGLERVIGPNIIQLVQFAIYSLHNQHYRPVAFVIGVSSFIETHFYHFVFIRVTQIICHLISAFQHAWSLYDIQDGASRQLGFLRTEIFTVRLAFGMIF